MSFFWGSGKTFEGFFGRFDLYWSMCGVKRKLIDVRKYVWRKYEDTLENVAWVGRQSRKFLLLAILRKAEKKAQITELVHPCRKKICLKRKLRLSSSSSNVEKLKIWIAIRNAVFNSFLAIFFVFRDFFRFRRKISARWRTFLLKNFDLICRLDVILSNILEFSPPSPTFAGSFFRGFLGDDALFSCKWGVWAKN